MLMSKKSETIPFHTVLLSSRTKTALNQSFTRLYTASAAPAKSYKETPEEKHSCDLNLWALHLWTCLKTFCQTKMLRRSTETWHGGINLEATASSGSH